MLFGALSGAFVLGATDGQLQELDGGGIAREVSTVLDDLVELVVQALDHVPGVDDLAGGNARNGMNRSHAFPRSHSRRSARP